MNFAVFQRFKVDEPDPDRLSGLCDHIMEALVDLDSVADPLISGDMTTGVVEIYVMVEANSHRAAGDKAIAAIRTAIHAAGSDTPNWPRLDESTELVDTDVPTGSAIPFQGSPR